jgi:[ribosomal protein S18]-alanine N-acetyltransferase
VTACQAIHTSAGKLDTPGPVATRCAGPSDLPALFELDRVCFRRRAWSLRAWGEVVTVPNWTTTVVEVDGILAAASVLLSAAPVSCLASLAVDPAWRRRGLARHLVRDALDRTRAASASWLSLEVDCSHAAAVTLYRQEGFGVLRRFREDGRWRQEMVRRLGGRRGV